MMTRTRSIPVLVLAALVSTTLIADGESTWFEGVQLLSVYALLGLVFLGVLRAGTANDPGGEERRL